MKKLYLFPVLFLCMLLGAGPAQAQSGSMLSGTIADEKGQSVGFVNVAVLDAASAKIVTGAIADMDGKFEIKSPAAGTYLLKLTSLGYVETKTAIFTVSGPEFSKNFGKIQLKSDAKTLKEVQVQALRPTVITHPDKMVVSVENTAMASGSTAYEVLTKSPGVWVDQDGNIQLNGKAGIQIMLNGKLSYLTGKELQTLLQGMSAENIKDLEIITNPSSKYDAEGASGIININLKKNIDFGLNGSVYGNYTYNKLNSYSAGTNFGFKQGKWNTTASLDFANQLRYRDINTNRIIMDKGERSTLLQDGYDESERISPSLRFNTDYDITDKHSVGFMARLAHTTSSDVFLTETNQTLQNAAENKLIDARNGSDGTYRNGTFNLHYSGKLDTAGTTLSADLDFVNLVNDDQAEFFNRTIFLSGNQADATELLQNDNPTKYNIYAAKIDFTKPLTKTTKLELGAKASHVISDNELQFYVVNDGRRNLDPNRSNHFIYTENIYAAYANLSAKLGDKWTMQAGLRAEQTESEGDLKDKAPINKRSYLNFFPTLFLQQKVNDNYQIGYKFSRRINRPHYESLNPFVFYLDKFTSAQGNPNLKPQYTNSFEITNTFKQTYNLILSYAETKDFMGEVPMLVKRMVEENGEMKEENATVFLQQNVEDLRNATATLVAPVRVSKSWEISNNLILMYNRYKKVIADEPVLNEKTSFFFNTNHNIRLPYGFGLELSGQYQGPAAYALYEVKSTWWADAGLKRSFKDDKLTLTMNVTDIFRSRTMNVDTYLNGNLNAIEQYRGTQAVRFSLRYKFNKGKSFEQRKRDTSLDELNRTGN